MRVTVDTSAFEEAYRAWGERMRAATEDGVSQAADAVKEGIQENLSRGIYPPASPEGEPPAYRSGFLHDEIYQDYEGTETGARAEIWPSTVYARIHELSGWAGRNHASFLPKRPYVEPALEERAQEIRQIMVRAWSQAYGG